MRKIMLVIGALVFLSVERVSALTIVRDFMGGDPPTNSCGSGNLVDIFNAACDVWELAIRDDFILTLHYGWGNTTNGNHFLFNQGGMPNRETEGLIRFNNDNDPNHFDYYLDPAPWQNNGYTNYTEEFMDLGGGVLNITRWFKGGGLFSQPYPQSDLLTVAIHEIGHALGMSFGNTTFLAEKVDGDVDITSPTPFSGTIVPLQYNKYGPSDHIAYLGYPGMSIMSGSFPPRIRAFPSVLDIIALAQLSQFTDLNLDLAPVLKIGAGQDTVVLSWIQPVGQYVLEQCFDLAQANWSTVDATVAITNGAHSVTVPTTNANAFFRLKKV